MSDFSIDKNDVDILKLFEYKREFQLDTPKGDVTIWLRVPGDGEINKSRVDALRKSQMFRKQLRDLNSDEHMAFIPDITKHTKEQITDAILLFMTRDLTVDAIKEVSIPYPAEPLDGDLEAMEKFQEEIDNYPKKMEVAVMEAVMKIKETEKKRFMKLTKDELVKIYADELIAELVSKRFDEVYRGNTILYGAFQDEDCTKKIFKDYDEYDNASLDLKAQLIAFMTELDMGMADLKK